MEQARAVDSIGCSVNRGAFGVMERANFRGFNYGVNVFRNTKEYLSWCINNGEYSKDAFYYKHGEKYGSMQALFDVHAQPIQHSLTHNLITNQGKNLDNDVMFGTVAKIATWYVLIFNTNTTPLAAHTYQVPGFTEDVDYDEAGRQEYIDVPSSSQVMTNIASRAAFTITTGGQTIYGGGLVGGTNGATKGNTAAGNYLYSSSLFSSSHGVLATNVISVDISITRT